MELQTIREEILDGEIIVVCGAKGSGKTSLSFVLLEWFKKVKPCYIYKHPKPELVEKLGFNVLNTFEQLDEIQDVCILIDEPQIHLPTYDRQTNSSFIKLASLCRQKNITIILATSDTRYVNRGIESYVDIWFIKDIRYAMVKNGSYIKNVIRRNSLIDARGFQLSRDRVLYSNVNQPQTERKYQVEQAPYFSDSLSKAYHNEPITPKKTAKK